MTKTTTGTTDATAPAGAEPGGSPRGTGVVTVRFFAGAAEAAGGGRREIELGLPATVAEVADALRTGASERFGRILAVATWLVDGERARTDSPVPAGAVVDCLPPFAGG